MIYFTDFDQERHRIRTFLDKKENWQSYLILVTIKKEDQVIMAKQIIRSKLDSLNWLIVTPEEFKSLEAEYETFIDLFVMELTMTGDKKDLFLGINWQLLAIEHEPKTDPFDEVMTNVMNDLIDQVLYNSNQENKIDEKRINQLLIDLMQSGMFKMTSDPKKVMGH